jgi:hypothetical protein
VGSADQFGALPPASVASFGAGQLEDVRPVAFGTLNALQVGAFEGPALKAISNGTPYQLAHLVRASSVHYQRGL